MKELRFNIPDDLADKFELAIQLAGDNRDAVAETFIRQYLARALADAAKQYSEAPAVTPVSPFQQRIQPAETPFRGSAAPIPPVTPIPPRPEPTPVQPVQPVPDPDRPNTWQEWGKAIGRIPRWARNPQQNNHKILRAWFELQKEMGRVTIDALRRRCSDPISHPNTYVPHFDNNFTQMKFDNGNSHGKVFEEQDGVITIWDRISDTLQGYRDLFLR